MGTNAQPTRDSAVPLTRLRFLGGGPQAAGAEDPEAESEERRYEHERDQRGKEHAAEQHGTQMQGAFLLSAVVLKRAAILQLMAIECQALLFWRDAFFALDLGFDVVNGVSLMDVQGDRLACERLDEKLSWR